MITSVETTRAVQQDMKFVALMERRTVRAVVTEVLSAYLGSYAGGAYAHMLRTTRKAKPTTRKPKTADRS